MACAPPDFAEGVVSFDPGPNAGFGSVSMPDIVLGPPVGAGDAAGSIDVVSLGLEGEIVLELGAPAIDGPGVDLLVFENAFIGWVEPGEVSVSADGETWYAFECSDEEPFDGCAGVAPVFSSTANDLDPADPTVAGGDQFDLAEVGLSEAPYVRIRDIGMGAYEGVTGGFDLDAIARVPHQ